MLSPYGKVDRFEDGDFVLASASPRREQLLTQMRARFSVMPAHIDETPEPDECPKGYVLRMARNKAETVYRRVSRFGDDKNSNFVVLGADTIVLGEQILGKPTSKEHGIEMLLSLSGKVHSVQTAVALVLSSNSNYEVSDVVSGQSDTDSDDLICVTRLVESEVTFRTLSEEECLAYWQSGEPGGKAGGYAIQGMGGIFVSNLKGSYSGVVGLPLAETYDLLREFKIPCGLSWKTEL